MTSAPGGTIYLIDRTDLLRVTADGSLHLVARRLSEDRRWDVLFNPSQRHRVQGVYADDAGHVWVAVTELRVVKKVSPEGVVTVVARSAAPWSPTGVLATPDGDLWILEYGAANEARVRHIAPDGNERPFGKSPRLGPSELR
jgi:streptogramin lyase